MKKKIPYLFLLLASFTWSCEDIIDLEVPDGDVKLVVDGLLTDVDSIHTVKLSTTSPYFSGKQTPRVSGAIMYLTSSSGDTTYFIETAVGSGEYKIKYQVRDNIDYYLNIMTPDGKQYRSHEESLHRVPPIDSLYQGDEYIEEIPDFREGGYYVNLATREPEGVGDYYRWTIYINGEKVIDPFNIYVIDDRLYDGNPITDWDLVYGLQPGDRVVVHQMSISKRAYRFWYLLHIQAQNFGSPFDTPPAEIEGNLYNISDEHERVLGFFGVSRVEKDDIIIKNL
jgi:hypothetical protein